MIRRPGNWTFVRYPDRLVLTSTSDILSGSIRYFERLRPLMRLGDLLVHHLSTLHATTMRREHVEPFVTMEGEYGGLVRLSGEYEGKPTAWSLGFVFGDDFYAYLEGRAPLDHRERLHNTVRDLAMTEELGLGIRHRRFVFRPPPWPSLTLGVSIAHYLHTSYPLVDSRISVYPAVPHRRKAPIIDFQRTMGEHILVGVPGSPQTFELDGDPTATAFETASGLTGSKWYCVGVARGRRMARDIVVVADDTYLYACELCSRIEHHDSSLDVYLDVSRSIQPLPSHFQHDRQPVAFSHYVD